MICFERHTVQAQLLLSTGEAVVAPVEIRVNPITGRTSRIAFSRTGEREAATDRFPAPPPFSGDTAHCPFCAVNLCARTPHLLKTYEASGRLLFSDYLDRERGEGRRTIGATGGWEWLAAFAPEGFFEIWGILPGATSLSQVTADGWRGLAQGVLNTQRYYRSLNRNGYNLGILAIAEEASRLELRVVILARSNYAPWVRSDHTSFEVMLGDMTTFTAPEETARAAKRFWEHAQSTE